jgi:RNA polymerase sigma-70 factor, ECF subfamily
MGEREAVVARVRSGDESAFGELVRRHRRELQVHCYRMLGSLEEAEDLVQETFLRAWRAREGFSGQATFRAWLYRIATNACLDVLARRPRRVLPYDVAPAADPDADTMPPPSGHAWLEPCPDSWLRASNEDAPDAVVVAKETIELAFLAAIQHLTPRQRAVLILRDVLGWPAGEVAAALDTSVAAVKSALQRARPTLRRHLPRRRSEWTSAPSDAERAVLARYLDAHERGDADALAAVLAEDVRVSFPPRALWADGREAFITGSRKFAFAGEHRFVPVRANLQPACAIYLRAPGDSAFRPLTLEVLRIEDGWIVEIVDFSSPHLFAAFGLAATLREPIPSSRPGRLNG